MEEQKKNPELRFQGFTEDWKEIILGKNSTITAGATPSTLISEYWSPKQIPWMSSGEINKKRLWHTENMISKKGLENSSAKWVPENSVLIALAGQGKTRGTVAINNLPLTTNQSIAAIITQENLNHEFLFQNLETRYEELRSLSSGDSSRGGLNKQIISEIIIKIPSKKIEQQQVGSFFKNIDELITKHQNKHKRLVTLKKSMLEKMFPKEGESVPEIRFQGFGKYWEIDTLNELGITYTGLSGKTKKDFGHGDAKYITYMNVFSNAIADPSLTDSVEVDNSQNCVEYGDVLFTVSSETPEEVGFTSVWTQKEKNIYLNSFCFGYRPAKKFDLTFLANALRSRAFRKQIIVLAQGISRFNISKTKVMDLELCLPDYEEQVKIGLYFKDLDSLIKSHKKQLQKLKNFKQSLSEKMFV